MAGEGEYKNMLPPNFGKWPENVPNPFASKCDCICRDREALGQVVYEWMLENDLIPWDRVEAFDRAHGARLAASTPTMPERGE